MAQLPEPGEKKTEKTTTEVSRNVDDWKKVGKG